ncbi:cupin domain-containing protein [Spiractinospora alimapuensis]|uniref:cupin domain-containing protein n=1 Tax=Spiractinospora alimapuensis TaxID=2820884 RepID=UPI001F207587|nr:cupin domain-containing protein [Spiractinospora alimapuensis]QVQ52955.1 cupin domain-containing protein [Spiractinospora alimapuensis]
MPPLLHLTTADHADPTHWPDGRLTPASLESEGFVHASGDDATLLAVANTLYRDVPGPLVALEIDPDRLGAEVRWEDPHPAPPAGVGPDVRFPHIYGPIPATAVTGRRFLRPSPHDGGYTAVERRPATAELLDLAPHPEGGWFRQTWRTGTTVTPDGYPGARATATGILFLLPVGEESRWHTVRSDELWVFNRGGELELLLGGTGPEPTTPTTVRLGTDLEAGHHPQHLVPAGQWQAARPAGDQEVLVTCVVSPGFDFADFAVEPD